jgi:arginine/lysine/ornithine decarboxylase
VQCRCKARRSVNSRRFCQARAKFAAKVFNADKTYFVLNGTSAANKVVTNALLTRGDLVLFDPQ